MLHIDLTKKGLTLNGVFMEKIDENKFAEILGEPRKNIFEGKYKGKAFSRSVWIWDDLGFLINIPTDENREYSLEFELAEDVEFRKSVKYNFFDVNPKGFFTGKFTLNGKAILEAFSEKELKEAYISLEKKIGIWEVNFDFLDEVQAQIEALSSKSWKHNIEEEEQKTLEILKNNPQPFQSFWFAYTPPKPKKQANPKYRLRKATADDVVFDNFNFKLAVVEVLMYHQEILTPKFDVYEFCSQYTKRDIDPNDYYDEIIPEVKKWFEDLPITKEMAEKVTELYFDGGNEIFLHLIPQWDGEDNTFNIQEISERELSQFPNLKTIDGTALMMSENAKKFLEDKGIIFYI